MLLEIMFYHPHETNKKYTLSIYDNESWWLRNENSEGIVLKDDDFYLLLNKYFKENKK